MRTLPLAALLLTLGAAAAAAAAAAAPARAPAWVRAKADARRWTDNLLAKVREDPRFAADSFEEKLGGAWKMAANIERDEILLDVKRAKAAPRERARSRKLLELNLLYLYGNILPRILDECTGETLPGRAYAGKDLRLAVDEKTYRRGHAELVAGYDVPPELVKDYPPPGGK